MLLKKSKNITRPRVDFIGIGLMSSSLLLLLLGLNLVGERPSAVSMILAGILVLISFFLGICFLKQEKRAHAPIIDTKLLESRAFVAANVSNLIVGMTSMGLFSFIPLYAISVHKFSTLMSGMILTPRSLAMTVTSAATSFLLRRLGYRWPMVIGFITMGLGIILLTPGLLLTSAGGALGGVIGTFSIIMFLNGISAGMVFPSANNACIELMPEKVGTIVGLRNMFRNIGGALAISLITFVLHLSPDAFTGFMIVFISFGIMPLVAVPLLFLMPAGARSPRSRIPRQL